MPLTTKEICQKFYISKNKLYLLTKNRMTQLIQRLYSKLKVRKSKRIELLVVGLTVPVRPIPKEVGYNEY